MDELLKKAGAWSAVDQFDARDIIARLRSKKQKPINANIENLQALRTKLKSGEYDGGDIMAAWIAIDVLIEQLHDSAGGVR